MFLSILLGSQFRNFWKKCTGNPNMCTTLVRKLTETACSQHTPDVAPDVARHLNHSEKTAREHYVLIDKRQKAVGISTHIRGLQRGHFENETRTKSAGNTQHEGMTIQSNFIRSD